MRNVKRAVAIAGFALGAFFLVGGLAGLIGLAADWDADPDLGRSGIAEVSVAYLAIALVFAALALAIWPRHGH
jgi:hypothetical protein